MRTSNNLLQLSRHDELAAEYQIRAKKALAIWTVLDQKKLISCDALHSRLLEYHNNIHTKEFRPPVAKDALISESIVVAQVFNCLDKQSFQRPYPLTNSKLITFLQDTNIDPDTTGCLWIHIKDLSVLPRIAEKYDIHDLIVSGFEDMRCHSCVIPTKGALLVTLCNFQMEQTDLKMYKLFVYAAKGLIVTYQQEILGDLNDNYTPPVDTIVDSVLVNYKTIHKRCLVLGPMYVMYELGMASLSLQDTAMEYLSCALTYFNRVVHLNLLHREKLDIMIKMHIIASVTIIMQRSIQEAEAVFATFVSVALGEPIQGGHSNNNQNGSAAMSVSNLSNNGYGLKRLLCPALIEDHHIAYLVDMSDAYIFVCSCLQNIINETARLDVELDATIQIRSGNTNLVLSLTATVFLPLTFLAGIFGMNFDTHSDYTIELLNYEHGPVMFTSMCIFCFLITITYFVYQGWLEIAILRKFYKKFSPNKIDDSKKPTSEKAIRRAEAEEKRRERIKKFRRSLSSATHRHEYLDSGGKSDHHSNPLLTSDYFSDTDESEYFKGGNISPGSGLRKGYGAPANSTSSGVVKLRHESDESSVAMNSVSSQLQSIPE